MHNFVETIEGIAAKVKKLVPDKTTKEKYHLTYLDVRMLSTPALGIAQSKKEILMMAQSVEKMMGRLRDDLASDEPDSDRIEVPLNDGVLQVRALLRGVYEALGLTPPEDLDELRWSIDVESAPGKARLDALSRRTNRLIAAEITDQHVAVSIDRDALDATGSNGGPSLESRLNRLTAALILQRRGAHGLTLVTDEEDRMLPQRFLRARDTMPQRVVVLAARPLARPRAARGSRG